MQPDALDRLLSDTPQYGGFITRSSRQFTEGEKAEISRLRKKSKKLSEFLPLIPFFALDWSPE